MNNHWRMLSTMRMSRHRAAALSRMRLSSVVARPVLKPRYDNFIDGQFVPPSQGLYFDNVSPIDGQVFTQAARSDKVTTNELNSLSSWFSVLVWRLTNLLRVTLLYYLIHPFTVVNQCFTPIISPPKHILSIFRSILNLHLMQPTEQLPPGARPLSPTAAIYSTRWLTA